MTSRFGPPVAEARPYQLKVTDRVQSLRDEWLALGERVRHPFATCDWLSLWRRHFGRPRQRLTLICARGSDGQLLGAVHRAILRRSNDHTGAITRPEPSPSSSAAVHASGRCRGDVGTISGYAPPRAARCSSGTAIATYGRRGSTRPLGVS
jgi:hypothetical protein